jgi:hypothetical protein
LNFQQKNEFLKHIFFFSFIISFISYLSIETCWDTQSPKYKPFKLDLGAVCDGDVNKKFIFRVQRVKSNKAIEFMGDHKVSPSELSVNANEAAKKIDIFDKKGKDIADVYFELFSIREEFTFIDYLMAGLDINLTVAIDFTGSNGDPKSPSSLHYIDPTGRKPNQYIDSLRAIGNIVSHYSQKQYYPALGYGGFVSIDGAAAVTSHCFPLSLSAQYPYFNGIEGIVQGYVNALPRIQLSGPTYFHDVINAAALGAQRPFAADYQHYNILLIITDGVINEMHKTIDAICSASQHPLSIIIVGVGEYVYFFLSFSFFFF